jgi:hypothetical protein
MLRPNFLLDLPYDWFRRIDKEKLSSYSTLPNATKIFDELLKRGNIKLSHTIPSIEEFKRRVYGKWCRGPIWPKILKTLHL